MDYEEKESFTAGFHCREHAECHDGCIPKRFQCGSEEIWAGPLSSPINLEDLHTPALLIDLEVMEENLRKMSAHLQKSKARLRPHTKTHKCPIIAKMQMDLGAVGVCCAKVSEAEVMVESGIDRVLITSPVVTTEKIARVIALAEKTPHVEIVVDHPKNVRDFMTRRRRPASCSRYLSIWQ